MGRPSASPVTRHRAALQARATLQEVSEVKACCKTTLQVWRRKRRAETQSRSVLQCSAGPLNSVRPRGGAGGTGVGAADSKLAVYEGYSGERGLLFVQARLRACCCRACLRAASTGAACAAC